MGYNSEFAIRVRGLRDEQPVGDMTGRRPVTLEQIVDNLQEMTYYNFYVYDPAKREVSSSSYVNSLGDEPFVYCSAAKWYEHEEDLEQLSARYPDLELFVLGVGEDALFGDVWTQTYQKGTHTEKDYQMSAILSQ